MVGRVQQHGYLTPSERSAFQQYAERLGLDGTGLAGLLLARELKARRLSTMQVETASGQHRMKVTAHLANPEIKVAFAQHSRALNITPTAGATALFRAELSERWLEKSIDST
jgi:hypothetical protein